MTNEEAIEYNENLKAYMRITDKDSEYKFLEENYEALDMGIKALKQQNFEGKTNGDVIKAMFPSVEVKEKNNGYEVYFGVGTAIQFFNHKWWNSSYKGGDKE